MLQQRIGRWTAKVVRLFRPRAQTRSPAYWPCLWRFRQHLVYHSHPHAHGSHCELTISSGSSSILKDFVSTQSQNPEVGNTWCARRDPFANPVLLHPSPDWIQLCILSLSHCTPVLFNTFICWFKPTSFLLPSETQPSTAPKTSKGLEPEIVTPYSQIW
jgi:hypothetical protein